MTKAGAKLIEAAKEAVSVAKGEQPAGRLHHNGHSYVPEADYATLRSALRTIQDTCARYIHPEGTMTKDEFID